MLALAALATQTVGRAQDVRVVATEGRVLAGRLLALDVERGQLLIARPDGAGNKSLAWAEVLSIHGASPARRGSVVAHLVGGERVFGDLVEGDLEGETFGLIAPHLGRLAVPIDRLDVLMFRARAGDARVADFRIPADADGDEALFRRARRLGFSMLLGGIHRFRDGNVLFEPSRGRSGNRESFSYDDLVAVALRGGVPRAEPATAMLLTRSGTYVGVRIDAFEGGKLRCAVEGAAGTFEIGFSDIAALVPRAEVGARHYLSDLPVTAAEERSFFDDESVLLPYARDASVSGGDLVVDGMAFGKGIGAHSRSALTWTVPDGCKKFRTVVGIDDAVRALGLRAAVKVAIRVGETAVFEAETLRLSDGVLDPGPIAVEPGQSLTLVVDFGPGFDLGDRVVWGGAVFLP